MRVLENLSLAAEQGRDLVWLIEVTLGCVPENSGSLRVIEKLGFRLVGQQHDHFFRFGRWWDHLLYELHVDAFVSAKAGY